MSKMRRKTFLASLTGLLPASLFIFTKARAEQNRADKGFKVAKGEGRKHGHIQLKDVNSNVLDVKVSGSDTGGDLAIFEQTSLSQGRGVPLHVHPMQDEIFYVLEGSYYFQVGEDKYSLAAGDSIFLPRAIPHAWSQVSPLGKMIVILQPAGKLENFFLTLRDMKRGSSPAEIAGVFADNEMKVVGPPLEVPK